MNNARDRGGIKLGFALVLLIVALGVQAQCSAVRGADLTEAEQNALYEQDMRATLGGDDPNDPRSWGRTECYTGDLVVRSEEVFACQNGVLEPMITVSRSQTAVAATAASFSVGSLLIGLAFGTAIGRRDR